MFDEIFIPSDLNQIVRVKYNQPMVAVTEVGEKIA